MPFTWQTIVWALPLGWVVFTLIVFTATPYIDFQINSKYVSITLFGISIRKISLSDIHRVSKNLKGKPEIWRNTFNPNHRMLVIYRKNQLRPIVITPKNRYVFRNRIEEEIKKHI